jgi:superoxide dismutase, Fe-Mn family
MAFQLPPLPYDYSALEPVIDTETMQLHHDKHHAAYVNNLNAALEKHPEFFSKTPEQIITNLNSVPEDVRTTVRNNAGGHVNHSMFWKLMHKQDGSVSAGAIVTAVDDAFGGFEAFQKQFNEAGAKHFGSGWVWLVRAPGGQLRIITTPNQDNPLMQGLYPILGNDVWEHAYYLKYRNRRPEYLAAWWQIVNWNEVNRRLDESSKVLKQTAA